MFPALTAVFLAFSAGGDTTVVLGQVERDLTGDGQPEVLRVVATGKTIDSLDVVLSIDSRGTTIYRIALAPVTRRIGFDADRRMRSRTEQREWLAAFGGRFFDQDKFVGPAEFISSWKSRAPERVADISNTIARDGGFFPDSSRAGMIWREIQGSGITIFEFATGGDGVVAIGWSARDSRFYRLLECC